MKKRIGNDIQFTWHIYRKDGDTQVPESFTGKDVEVKLISPLQRPVTIEDVSIATGVVTFTFRGKHQVTLGNYVAVLLENKGEDGMVTLDVVNAVTLVPHSYMEEDGDEGDVIEAESVELESTISAGSGGGIEQQQADWAQTDDTAVDFIKNKPDPDLYCRKDADNTHSDGVRDIFAKLVYDEHNPSVLMQADRLTVSGDSIKFYHSHRGEETKELLLQLDDVEKLKNLPTATELAQELGGKANTADLAEVATSGSYNDLSDKPTIPAAQVQSDWNEGDTTSKAYIKNKPTIPTVPSNVSAFTNDAGYLTQHQDITGKADKVSNATNGNFAALDNNGNLIDSGHKHSDYITQHQDLSNYVQKSQTTGLLKNDGTVDTNTYLTQHQDISGKQDKMPITQVASGTSAINAAINTYYEVAGEVGTLAITLPTPTDLTKVSMVVVHLTAGTTPNVVIGSTETIDYSAAYDISAGKEYEINCLFNGGKWIVADMEVV